jgi:micrococcal nuclease
MKIQKILSRLFLFLFLFLFIFSIPSHAEVTAKVLWVVDGDTLKIEFEGKKESIRLIGIDTPESRINPKAKKDAERSRQDIETIIAQGKKAAAFVKTLVKKGDTVKIEFDVQQRDKYRRLLGYVYLSDGRMLNEEIVKAGYASLMTYPPNVRHVERFRKAYQEARGNRRGLWGD